MPEVIPIEESLTEEEPGGTVGYRSATSLEEESTPGAGEPEDDVVLQEDYQEEPEEDLEEEEPEAELEVDEEEEELPEVSPELEEERKNLQKVFTEKMQEVGGLRLKANLVDAIDRDPEATLAYLAEQYGIDLGGKTEPAPEGKKLTFDDLPAKEDEDMASYLQRLVPHVVVPAVKEAVQGVFEEQGKATAAQRGASTINQAGVKAVLEHLNTTYSDWATYEKEMIGLIMKHPTLARDPDELYKLAKGASVNPTDMARAKKTKKVVKKVASTSRPTKSMVVGTKGKKLTFDQAWELAKQTAAKG